MTDMDRRGWHIDKGVPIAVIVTIVVLSVQFARHLGDQDSRISNVETEVRHLKKSRSNDQQRSEKKFDELKTDLRLINRKLDRLIESDR